MDFLKCHLCWTHSRPFHADSIDGPTDCRQYHATPSVSTLFTSLSWCWSSNEGAKVLGWVSVGHSKVVGSEQFPYILRQAFGRGSNLTSVFLLKRMVSSTSETCVCSEDATWGFIKNPGLSVTYSWQIGFWEHDIEASKMQGRARGRKGERKTYHITILYIQISCMYYLIDYLYHILPFCLARWSLSRSVEAFVFKKCPACSLVMWHVEWRIVPSGVSIGRRMLAFCFFAQEIHYIYNVLWGNRAWPKEPLAQDPRKRNVPGQVPPVQPGPSKGFPTKKDSS